MKQFKELLKLFANVTLPYFWGASFVVFGLIATWTTWEKAVWLAVASFCMGLGQIIYYFTLDSKEKIQAGWKPTVFILMAIGVVAMLYLAKYIGTY